MIAPFFEPVAFASSSRSGASAASICTDAAATDSTSRGARRRSSRVAVWRTSSRTRRGSSDVIVFASLTKTPPPSVRISSSGGSADSSAQLERPRRPEVVVLVEVPLLAGREVVAPAGEPVVERRERLVAIEVDALALARDLVLEVGEVLLPLLAIDLRDDRGGEVEDLLELARSDVEQVADAARNALEEPDVRDRRGEVDVTHALAAHLLPRHLDAAALADDALVADALVLAAVALPVLRRTEDALAEETVTLGLERAVVDRLRLRDLAGRPVANLLRRRQADPDRVEVVDVDHVSLRLISCRRGDELRRH